MAGRYGPGLRRQAGAWQGEIPCKTHPGEESAVPAKFARYRVIEARDPRFNSVRESLGGGRIDGAEYLGNLVGGKASQFRVAPD